MGNNPSFVPDALFCLGWEDHQVKRLIREISDAESSQTEAAINKAWVGDKGAIKISRALLEFRETSYISALDLPECLIGDDGAKALAGLLRGNNRITWLRLAANRIGPEGGVALARAIAENGSLLELSLGTTSAEYLNNFGPEGATAMAEALKTNKTLTILGFRSNGIGDEGDIALANALKYNSTLLFLRVADNGISDVGAAAFAVALKLRFSKLKMLGLFKNDIGPQGVTDLAEALKVNDTLEALGIARNPVGSEGVQSLLDALEYNDRMVTIDHHLFPRDIFSIEQEESFKTFLENNRLGKRTRRRFVVQPAPHDVDDEDWIRWRRSVRHDRPPADLLNLSELGIERRPYDNFLVNTGADKKEFVLPMSLHFATNCFRTFLDFHMRDLDGSPTEQMRRGLETCRYTICIISHAFLRKHDPREELLYCFNRSQWIDQRYHWRSMKVILLDLTVNEYQAYVNAPSSLPSLPSLHHDLVLWELDNFDTWDDLCDEVKTDLFRSDTEQNAVEKWKSYLQDWESNIADGFTPANHLYSRTGRFEASVDIKVMSLL